MITKETLQDFFDHTRKLHDEGGALFNIDETCRWSFFFVDADRAKLRNVGLVLEAAGYEVIGFQEPGPGDDDQTTIYLRADRIEKHTVESLHVRNAELYDIAHRFGVKDYDGMDVGGIDGP